MSAKTAAIGLAPLTGGSSLLLLEKNIAGAVGLGDPPGSPEGIPPPSQTMDETGAADTARAAERKRRQLIASQNRLIKTTPLGAAIGDESLGGKVTLSGS